MTVDMAPALLVHRAPVLGVSMIQLEQLEIALAGEALTAFTPPMARVTPNTAISLRMLAPICGGLVDSADQGQRFLDRMTPLNSSTWRGGCPE